MQEWADRPLRVPGEAWPRHALRLLRWGLNLRLLPARRERGAGGWLGALRSVRLGDLVTRPGQVLLWGSVMVALLGFRNRSSFPLIGAGVALTVVAWSLLAGQALRPRVRVAVRLEGPASVGTPHRAHVDLENLRRRLPAFDLSVRALRHPGLRRDADTERALLTRLRGGQRGTLPLTLTARRRGTLRLDGLAVQSDFPWGLTRATARVPAPLDVVALPPAPRLELPPLRALAADLGGRGEQRARHREGVEYRDSRPFQTGDSPLRLDHRASARRGALYSRVHEGSERYLPSGTALVVEASVHGYARWQRRPRDPRLLDRRIGAAAEIARRATAEQLPVRALWLGSAWETPADADALWRALADCPARRAPALPEALPPPELLCVLVTGNANAPVLAWLERARSAGRVVAWVEIAENARDHVPLAVAGHYRVAP